MTVNETVNLRLDIKKCISGFTVNIYSQFSRVFTPLTCLQHSRWDANIDLIMDFKLVLVSIPSWMIPYSKAPAGCIHRIQMTLKAHSSAPQYMAFTNALRSILTDTLYTCLEWAALYLNHP